MNFPDVVGRGVGRRDALKLLTQLLEGVGGLGHSTPQGAPDMGEVLVQLALIAGQLVREIGELVEGHVGQSTDECECNGDGHDHGQQAVDAPAHEPPNQRGQQERE